jgi:hemerythrin
MEFFQWKDSFSVNNKEMDDQHKRFFSLLNELNEIAEKQGGHKEEFGKIYEELSDYADLHFQNEEHLCEIHAYPDLEQQNIQHQFFRDELQRLGEEFHKGKPIAAKALLIFLRDWLINHILQEDKKYAQYLAKPGV